ncbi:uncharacterized protein LOC144158846 isoform X1 [Haemaphysalis longicornis]
MGQRFTKPPSHFLLNPRGLAYFLGDLDLPVHGFRGSQHQITHRVPSGAAAGCPGSAACQSSSQGFARASPGQPPAGPKLRPAFPWCSVCFATRKSHSFVCHLAPSHSAHPFKRTSFPRPQALLPFSAPTDSVLAGAHGYFMKHRNSEATTEKRLKAFNGYVANLLRDMK